jgi:hypothetical protein
MALELKISESSYDRVTNTVTLNDDTGIYNVTTNPGGFGTPNPERNTLALVVSAVRIYNQVEVVKWNDPINDTSFDYDFISDGVYDIYLCALPFEAGAFDPNLLATDYVFYSVLDNAVYKVVENTDGTKEVNETNDVVSNSSHISSALKYMVKSYNEKKRIALFCEDINSCTEDLSVEYKDLSKSLEAAECYFHETFYLQSDNTFVYMTKIDKQR